MKDLDELRKAKLKAENDMENRLADIMYEFESTTGINISDISVSLLEVTSVAERGRKFILKSVKIRLEDI